MIKESSLDKKLSKIQRITSVAENLAFLGSAIYEQALRGKDFDDENMKRLVDAFKGEMSSMQKQLSRNLA